MKKGLVISVVGLAIHLVAIHMSPAATTTEAINRLASFVAGILLMGGAGLATLFTQGRKSEKDYFVPRGSKTLQQPWWWRHPQNGNRLS